MPTDFTWRAGVGADPGTVVDLPPSAVDAAELTTEITSAGPPARLGPSGDPLACTPAPPPDANTAAARTLRRVAFRNTNAHRH